MHNNLMIFVNIRAKLMLKLHRIHSVIKWCKLDESRVSLPCCSGEDFLISKIECKCSYNFSDQLFIFEHKYRESYLYSAAFNF